MPINPQDEQILTESLPALQRLALAYAPRTSRVPTLALLALDTRLAGIVRSSHEPMLAQLRLAWWRKTLTQEAKDWPIGEPLLAALSGWNGLHHALCGLVDGWEAMTGPAPLDPEAFKTLADSRGESFAALASAIGAREHGDCARSLGEEWALCDLASRLSNETEIANVMHLLHGREEKQRRLARSLRPLIVLHGVTKRTIERKGEVGTPSFMTAIRLGLLGR